MELKDVILSTIAELGEEPETAETDRGSRKVDESVEGAKERTLQKEGRGVEDDAKREEHSPGSDTAEEERVFLESLRERLLVLFEGFQSPNNKRVEAKIDLTLNFLEYLLALLDERIDTLKKRK